MNQEVNIDASFYNMILLYNFEVALSLLFKYRMTFTV